MLSFKPIDNFSLCTSIPNQIWDRDPWGCWQWSDDVIITSTLWAEVYFTGHMDRKWQHSFLSLCSELHTSFSPAWGSPKSLLSGLLASNFPSPQSFFQIGKNRSLSFFSQHLFATQKITPVQHSFLAWIQTTSPHWRSVLGCILSQTLLHILYYNINKLL